MDAQINKEQLKKNIEKLEIEVYSLSKLILEKTDSTKEINEDSFTDDEKKAKINAAELKAYKIEQKEKDKQLRIQRSIYTNLIRDLKTSGSKDIDAMNQLSNVFALIGKYQSTGGNIQVTQKEPNE